MAWYHKFPWTNFHELNLDWILEICGKAEKAIPEIDEAITRADTAAEGAEAGRNAAINASVSANMAAEAANNAARKIDPITATAATVHGASASVTVEDTNPGKVFHFLIPAGEKGDPGPAAGVGDLIDNGNFTNPINQRGKTSYNGTGSKMYTIDRWFTTSSVTGAVVVGNRYITVASGATISQIIPADQDGSFPSDTDVGYTAVARETNGTLHIANGSGLTDSKLSFVLGDADAGITVTLGSGNWEYCALYKGDYNASNIPGFVPKGYQTEFINCQRYFVGGVGRFSPVSINEAGNARMCYATPVPMRVAPTAVLISGDNVIFNVAGTTKVLAVTGVSVESRDNNFIYINISCAADSSMLYAAGSTYLTKFDLSADM